MFQTETLLLGSNNLMSSPHPSSDQFMDAAFSLAREALLAKEVPIGCVFVYDSEIIGGGRNTVNDTKNATRHAELVAVDKVFHWYKTNTANLKDKSLAEILANSQCYVTVEPCGMCASALEQLKVQVILYGADNERFGGCGSVLDVFKLKGAFQPTIIKGVRAEEAVELLKQFYQGENPNAPVPKLKR